MVTQGHHTDLEGFPARRSPVSFVRIALGQSGGLAAGAMLEGGDAVCPQN